MTANKRTVKKAVIAKITPFDATENGRAVRRTDCMHALMHSHPHTHTHHCRCKPASQPVGHIGSLPPFCPPPSWRARMKETLRAPTESRVCVRATHRGIHPLLCLALVSKREKSRHPVKFDTEHFYTHGTWSRTLQKKLLWIRNIRSTPEAFFLPLRITHA